jgi:hypothetical protein
LGRRLGKSKKGNAKLKGNVAGEAVKSKPRNQTSVRFRSTAMAKIPELVGNIPKAEVKNQMSSDRLQGLYHKMTHFVICRIDLSTAQ